MARILPLIILIVCSHSSFAGQVINSSVNYDAGVYSLDFDVEIDADYAAVRALVTDYPNLSQLSKILVASELLNSLETEPIRRRLVARVCVFLFCRQLQMVEDIEEVGESLIITTIVPELSDFKSGITRWQLTELPDRRIRIELNCIQEPAFWVPPLIGPVLVKRRLLREAATIINNIESRAAGHD